MTEIEAIKERLKEHYLKKEKADILSSDLAIKVIDLYKSSKNNSIDEISKEVGQSKYKVNYIIDKYLNTKK